MADITMIYKGKQILELSESGQKTIETAGKYCEDDITLEYTKPESASSEEWKYHKIEITIPQSTAVYNVLHTYIKKCVSWRITPNSESTSTNTIAIGTSFSDESPAYRLEYNFLGSITTPLGVTINNGTSNYYYTNDQTYNTVRGRQNISGLFPAGDYILEIYGVLKSEGN